MGYPVMTARVDPITGAAIAMEYEHHEIHEGKSFTAWQESVAPLPTVIGEETAIGFITPSLPTRIHMIVDAWADDESVLEIRENPTVTLDTGADAGGLGRHRSIGDTSLMLTQAAVPLVGSLTSYTVLQAAAGDLSGGTVLHHETLAIAAGPPFASKLNTVSRGQREFILLPDTEYVVILTNSTGNPTVHNIILNWYELADEEFIN